METSTADVSFATRRLGRPSYSAYLPGFLCWTGLVGHAPQGLTRAEFRPEYPEPQWAIWLLCGPSTTTLCTQNLGLSRAEIHPMDQHLPGKPYVLSLTSEVFV
jgi:hypothetical protein